MASSPGEMPMNESVDVSFILMIDAPFKGKSPRSHVAKEVAKNIPEPASSSGPITNLGPSSLYTFVAFKKVMPGGPAGPGIVLAGPTGPGPVV